ncbi:MAG: group 1 truncated hemoglobin [Myxococcota bacterium]
MSSTPFERLGGETKLRVILSAFLDRVVHDMIIGFFFQNIDRAQLLEREFELASQHLGGPHRYQGRPLEKVHQPHRINTGQFHRRLWLLEQTLQRHQVDPDIIDEWLGRERKLLHVITTGKDCDE